MPLSKQTFNVVFPEIFFKYLFLTKGPLTAIVNGKVTVAGIVSFGRTTCTPLFPNGYERVTFQKDWILNNSDAASWQCGSVGNHNL
jgi:hypothetical protein